MPAPIDLHEVAERELAEQVHGKRPATQAVNVLLACSDSRHTFLALWGRWVSSHAKTSIRILLKNNSDSDRNLFTCQQVATLVAFIIRLTLSRKRLGPLEMTILKRLQ